jgi:hypothetical protein
MLLKLEPLHGKGRQKRGRREITTLPWALLIATSGRPEENSGIIKSHTIKIWPNGHVTN